MVVEPVPRGRPDGDPITVYAVETHAGEVLKTLGLTARRDRLGQGPGLYRARRVGPKHRQRQPRTLAALLGSRPIKWLA